MKSRIALLSLFLLLANVARAQESGVPDRLVLSLPQGGYVSFGNRSEWIDLRQASRERVLPAPLAAQALPDTNQIIHRILRDREGHFVFGYDLSISSDRATKQFTVAIKPLDARLEASLRANPPVAEATVTFPKSTEAQTLSDGAEFSVDLLVNKNTGVKIVDLVKLSFDRALLDDGPRLRARDFTLDAVAMEMKDYSLLVNDELITTGKSKTGSAGALLWIYVPQRGRFIFSLVPRAGYAFEKVGTVSAQGIEFSIRGDHYQWLSSSPVLHEEGSWNLWVLSDPKYTPLMGTGADAPPQDKGVLEKLDDKINTVIQRSPVGVQTPSGLRPVTLNGTEKPGSNSKVMFGAADRIENLMPRN